MGVVRAPAVHIEGSFAFAGAPLFRDLRLTLGAGRWTCLLGPSGAGKSTLLRLIAGLDTGGDFHGAVAAGDGAPVAPRIAYMAQSDLLAPWLDVTGNVLIGARLRGERPDRERAAAIISRVGLAAHAEKFPRQLSGGMRQRAALARTLMEDRPVALLDEPFSALDAGTRAQMQELAFRELSGRSVLLVTHDPAEAARLAEAIWLMDGKGLRRLEVPAAAPIRDPADASTLRAQAALLDSLRGRAA